LFDIEGEDCRGRATVGTAEPAGAAVISVGRFTIAPGKICPVGGWAMVVPGSAGAAGRRSLPG
jgi:hypothetical protein